MSPSRAKGFKPWTFFRDGNAIRAAAGAAMRAAKLALIDQPPHAVRREPERVQFYAVP